MCAISATNGRSCPEKRLLILYGSPRRDGPTSRLLAAFLEEVPAEWGVARLDAFALSPLPCDDCRYCYRVDGCSKPDLKEFYTALEEADALAFVTPVYNRSFPAPLKALLDRTQRYWAARFIRGIRPPITRPKQAFLLTAAGSGGDDAACVEQQLRPALTVLNARLQPPVALSGADQGTEENAALEAARAAGRSLLA